jgi:hypothetical protein
MSIWTSPFRHVPYFYTGYNSVDELANGYGVTFVGWSEDIGGMRVIEFLADQPALAIPPAPVVVNTPVDAPPEQPSPTPQLAVVPEPVVVPTPIVEPPVIAPETVITPDYTAPTTTSVTMTGASASVKPVTQSWFSILIQWLYKIIIGA